MLPRSARLRQTKEIQDVVHYGRRLTSLSVRIYCHAGKKQVTRVACVVGKTVDRSAVRRHRYQRWLREVVKRLLYERPLPHPYDMVWVAQIAIKQVASQEAVYQEVLPRWEELRNTSK